MELDDIKGGSVFVSVLFVIALSISGWALMQEVDLKARVTVLEAVSVQERTDNDRRFGELTLSIKSIAEKLDKISERLSVK